MVKLLDESSRRGAGQTYSRQTLILPVELHERLRNAAHALGFRASHVAAKAIEMALVRLEETHGPFDPRPGLLPAGRPTDAERRAAGLLP